MTMQRVQGRDDMRYKRKLFVDRGMGFREVEARLIEPYSPPTPQLKMKEIQVLNAPSHFHQTGLSSYKASLTLHFTDRTAFDDYLMYCGWTHKFYDEKGFIYLGSVTSMRQTRYPAGQGFKVEIELTLIKKDSHDRKHRFEFQDIPDDFWGRRDIEEMSDLGLVAVITRDGDPVLYFRPNDYVTRAEFITFLNRTRRLLEKILRE